MTLQVITPEWLASPEGEEWKKKLAKRNDKTFADVLQEMEIPLKQDIDIINRKG